MQNPHLGRLRKSLDWLLSKSEVNRSVVEISRTWIVPKSETLLCTFEVRNRYPGSAEPKTQDCYNFSVPVAVYHLFGKTPVTRPKTHLPHRSEGIQLVTGAPWDFTHGLGQSPGGLGFWGLATGTAATLASDCSPSSPPVSRRVPLSSS